MQKLKVVCFLILFSRFSVLFSSQQIIWKESNIDSLVSCEIPGEIFEFDTVDNNVYLKQIFSEVENERYVLQKTYHLQSNKGKNNNPLEVYSIVSNEMVREFGRQYAYKKEIIDLYGLEACSLSILDSLEQEEFKSVYFLLVDEVLYMMSYTSFDNFNVDNRDYFLSTLHLNENIAQQRKGNENFRNIRKFGYLPILIMVLILIIGLIIRRYFK